MDNDTPKKPVVNHYGDGTASALGSGTNYRKLRFYHRSDVLYQVDSALEKYLERKDREFTTQGGIRERMTAARLDQRASQRDIIEHQQQEIEALKREITRLKSLLNKSQLDNLD